MSDDARRTTSFMSTETPLARRVIAALLLVLLTACYSWRPTTVSPQTLIPAEQPSSVRATLASGEVITVRDPTMKNDSIVGNSDAGSVAVASRDLRLFEVRRLAVVETVGLAALGATVLGFAIAIFIYCSGVEAW